jgi:hypothetical protein
MKYSMYEFLQDPCENDAHYLIVLPKTQKMDRNGIKIQKYAGPINSRTHGPFPFENVARQKLIELLKEGTPAAKELGVWASGNCGG